MISRSDSDFRNRICVTSQNFLGRKRFWSNFYTECFENILASKFSNAIKIMEIVLIPSLFPRDF